MNDSGEMDDAKLAPLLEYLGERINRVFAYYFCVFEFKDNEDMRDDPSRNDRAWLLQTIGNACLDTTLIALRDIDDFLTPRSLKKAKIDDIRASDFGYMESHTFLTQSDREHINKLIAHTTTAGAHAQGFRWDVLELTSKGISQIQAFLEWVVKEYAANHFYLPTAAFVIQNRTRKHFLFITQEAEKRRHAKAMPND